MSWGPLITLVCVIAYVQGHGMVMDPPNRASLWRFGYNTPANYDDDGLNCGGFSQHWIFNEGRCGICGDAYDSRQPRAHELGGTFGQGHIVANFAPGDVITINVYLTVYHRGFWEFRICTNPHDNSHNCFEHNLVELETGGTRYYPNNGSGMYYVRYRLPWHLVCDHCVLQWKYTAGNNWGICPDGSGAAGCGNQETFYSCSDIAIRGRAFFKGSYEGLEDIPVDPVANPSGDLLRLLLLTNEIQDVHPSYDDSSRKKYMNRHKRKKTSKKTKRRRYKKILYHR